MPTKPILDPRTQLGLDQVNDVLLDLESAIAWADKSFNRGTGEEPAIYGRRIRVMCELLTAAKRNLTPAPSSTLPAIIQRYTDDVKREELEKQQNQLALSIPPQSRPAFANKAGAR